MLVDFLTGLIESLAFEELDSLRIPVPSTLISSIIGS